MGDPLQTGRELNRIHRPKFPTVLFGIAVILTLVGIVMQGILFSHMEMVGRKIICVIRSCITESDCC